MSVCINGPGRYASQDEIGRGRQYLAALLAIALSMSSLASAQDVTTRVSVDSAGMEGETDSYWPSVSADGRFVAFMSGATNLIPNDTNGSWDVFVRDRETGLTTRVSVDSQGHEGNGHSENPSISADGRLVAFWSDATNLVQGDTNGARDIFVHDRQAATTVCVSLDSQGNLGNDDSEEPSISADGRFVAFSSDATNLVPADTNVATDVFVHDRQAGVTTRVSVDQNGNQVKADCDSPSISADDRSVAFTSGSSRLVPNDTNLRWDIFVHDLQTGATTRISLDSSGNQGDGDSDASAISADGHLVAFMSGATNLVPNDTNGLPDVFVHDSQTGLTTCVSVDQNGDQGKRGSGGPSISGDGRFVAFFSDASNLVPGDTNGYRDAFVHDRTARTTTRSSVNSHDDQGDDDSSTYDFPAISADGRFVAFSSNATNLVPGDTNIAMDVFERGPELTLEVSDTIVSAGQTINFTTYMGPPGNPSSLWAVAINNTPVFALVVIGSFGGDGHFLLSGMVPPGLTGTDVVFRGYAIGQSALVIDTNDVAVSFQ